MDQVINAYECVFCKGWFTAEDAIPSFWDDSDEYATEWCGETQCVCLECSNKHLDFSEEYQDYYLKPIHMGLPPEGAKEALDFVAKEALDFFEREWRIITDINDGFVDYSI